MENLIIENRSQKITRKVVGGFWIFIAVGMLITGKGSPDEKEWLSALTFFILGILFFTPLMGSTKLQIEICDGCLNIIWMNRIRKITIQEADIEGITLAVNGILIKRKEKKPVKLSLLLMTKDQKKLVYEFFTEYAREKNLVQG